MTRMILLLSPLLVAGCSIHHDLLPVGYGGRSELSYSPPGSTISKGDDRDLACPGGYARGSNLQYDRGGTWDLLCY